MSNIKSVNICICILFIIIETYGNSISSNSHIKINETTSNIPSNIVSEAGVIPISVNNQEKKVEEALPKPIVNNATNINSSIHNTTTSLNREGVTISSTTPKSSTISPQISVKTQNVSNSNITSTTKERIIPVSEAEVPETVHVTNKVSSTTEIIEFTGDSKIKPRKGVVMEIENTTSTSTTTKKPRKMKPTVTVGSDDDVNVSFTG